MGHEPLLMGIDIGTSACKVAVFRQNGSEAVSAAETYPTYYPQPGYVEQDCGQWWEAVCRAIKQCLEKVYPEDIAGIGVDGQSWSCIPLSRSGEVLYRNPIWMDTRCTQLCRETEEEIGKEQIFDVAQNPFQPSYTTPKILWFQKNLPEIYEQTKVFLQSNSYIVYQLTGEITQDRSQCYGLHIYDMKSGVYDWELCKKMNMDPALFPAIRECQEVVGQVSAWASRQTGLPKGIPVVAGGLDAACGTLGAGVYLPGQTQEQGGQAGGMSICLDTPVSDPRLILGNHVIPGLWLLQGGTAAGGASYKWIAEAIGQAEKEEGEKMGQSQMYRMDCLADGISPGSDGLLFLPYLSGERSPIWDGDACGMYFGLDFMKQKGHFYRAVMEGTAYSLRHNLEVAEMAGAKVTSMNSMGGAAKSPVWMQIKTDITGIPMHVPKADTATTLGAAILAGIGTGIYPSFQQAVEQTIHLKQSYFPNPHHKKIYDQYFEIYLRLYRDNFSNMHSRADIMRTAPGR